MIDRSAALRRWIVGAWLAWLAVAALLVARAPFSADLTGFLPRAGTPVEQVLVDQLRDGVASRMALIALDGAAPAALAAASKALVTELARDARFVYLSNGSADRFAADEKFLERHRYALSPAVTPERFSERSLRTALEVGLELLSSSASTLVARKLPADPTGELLVVLNSLGGDLRPNTVEGVWFSRDGTRALAIAETRARGFDTTAQSASQAEIRRVFAAVAPPGATLTLAGPSVFAVTARSEIERDSWRLSIVAALCVVVILLLAYRSPVLTLVAALPVTTGILTGLAAVALGFPTIHGITTGFGATLIGEAIDYPTYLLAQRRPGEPLRSTAERIGPTLRLAVLTTTFSGLTMLLSSFQGLAQLGVLLVAGILIAGFVTRWVIPALGLERFLRVPRAAPPSVLDPGRLPSSGRRGALLVTLCLAAAVASLAIRSEGLWDDDLERLTPITAEMKNLDGAIRGDLGAPDVRYLVVVRTPSRESTLAASERLEPALARLVGAGMIESFDLAARFLPSDARQAERRAALPERAALAPRIESAQAGLPYRAGLFTPFLDAVEAARQAPPLTLADLAGTSLGIKVRSLLIEQAPLGGNTRTWVALIPLSGVRDAAALGERLGPALEPGMSFLDMKESAIAMVANYRGESLKLTALGIVAIVGVLFVGLRSVGATLRVLAPALTAAIVAMALLNLAGVRLSLFHLVSLLLVLGAGLNYSLFFQRPEPNADDRARTGLSLIVCAATTIAAFGALATSTMPVLRAIGLTTSIGIVLAFIFAAISAPRLDARMIRPLPD